MALTKYIEEQVLPLLESKDYEIVQLTEIVRCLIKEDLWIWEQMARGEYDFRMAIEDKRKEIKNMHDKITASKNPKMINIAKAIIIRSEREKRWLQYLRDNDRSESKRQKILEDGIAWLKARASPED